MTVDRIVHKFGGTSVLKEAPTILKIVLASIEAGEAPVVVLSALAGVTSLLEQVFKDRHEPALVESHLVKIDELHRGWLRSLGLDEALLDEHLTSLRPKFAAACTEARSYQQLRDMILALGEPLSVYGFTLYFNRASVEGAWWVATAFDTSATSSGMERVALRVSDRFGNASPLDLSENAELRTALLGQLGSSKIPIVTGFIGRSGSGAWTSVATVGRGGSDLSACYLGALLEANEIRIWSDVPGMLTADPRVVGQAYARPIPRLPFRHAMEMAGGGGKLHPRALVSAARFRIPVRMLSTFDPELPGTLITHDCELPSGLVGVVQLKATTIIGIYAAEMSETEGFVAQVTSILAEHGIVIGLMATGEVELTMTVTDPARRLDEALDKISCTFTSAEVVITRDVSLITVVHTRIDAAIEERVSGCLKRHAIEPLATSGGASRIALQFPVLADQADAAVRALHEELSNAK